MIVRDPCPCGESTIRGFWGGRFKDLLLCQGTRFFVADVEAALRSVEAVAKPSLEYQVVKPDGGDDAPLVVRVEVGDAGADRVDTAARCAAAVRDALGVDAVSRDSRARFLAPVGVQGHAARRPVARRGRRRSCRLTRSPRR